MSQEIVETLIQEPTEFEIKVKETGEMKTFKIPRICPGVVLKISGLLSKIALPSNEELAGLKDNEKISEGVKLIGEHTDSIIEILVMSIENTNKKPSPELIEFFKTNIDGMSELLQLLILVIRQLDIPSFLAILGSIQGVNLFKNDSTHGGLSAPQSNISDGQKPTSSGK